MLIAAGIETKTAAIEAYRSGELTDIKGIGPSRALDIAQALGLSDEGRVQSESADESAKASPEESVSIETDDGTDLFGDDMPKDLQ